MKISKFTQQTLFNGFSHIFSGSFRFLVHSDDGIQLIFCSKTENFW